MMSKCLKQQGSWFAVAAGWRQSSRCGCGDHCPPDHARTGSVEAVPATAEAMLIDSSRRWRARVSRTANWSSGGSETSAWLVKPIGLRLTYAVVQRFMRGLCTAPIHVAWGVIATHLGEKAQVDYGDGLLIRHPVTGNPVRAGYSCGRLCIAARQCDAAVVVGRRAFRTRQTAAFSPGSLGFRRSKLANLFS